MSVLARDFYASGGLLAAPVLAMLIFLAVFGIVVARALTTERKHLDRLACLPLAKETEGDGHE